MKAKRVFTVPQKRIFDAMQVEEGNLNKLFLRLRMTGAASTCKRCGGTGHYAYNYMHGTVCYGCSGSGIIVNDEAELREKAESEEVQKRLAEYLKELEEGKQKKSLKKVVNQVTTAQENSSDSIKDMYNDAISRNDWEFTVRLMIKLKNNNSLELTGKSATQKQINYIKVLLNKKKVKIQSDKDNLVKFISDCENGTQNINHIETQYIINWLTQE